MGQCGTTEMDSDGVRGTQPVTAAADQGKNSPSAAEVRRALRTAASITGWKRPSDTAPRHHIPRRPDLLRNEEEQRTRKSLLDALAGAGGWEYPSDDEDPSARTRAVDCPLVDGDRSRRPACEEEDGFISDEIEFLAEITGNATIDIEVHKPLADRLGMTDEEFENLRNSELVGLIERTAHIDAAASRKRRAAACSAGLELSAVDLGVRKSPVESPQCELQVPEPEVGDA